VQQDRVQVAYDPTDPGSEEFDDHAVVDYIARTNYGAVA
jgi:hypothetical protein